MSVRLSEGHVAEAGFQASGCAAVRAAASATVELVQGAPLLGAALLAPGAVAAELGGLSPVARHAAELAADAFHRALGMAARDGAARLPRSGCRTLVAMSGGVDSAAAARLALDAGEQVVAVTLELWSDPATDGERSCCSPQAVTGARALAHRMGIPHFTLDLREDFRAAVVDRFLEGYAEGRTPNPCVGCNGSVRFDSMLGLAERLGAARLVTGHYARIADDGRGPLIRAAADPAKDQSYVLARLRGEEIARLRFPLGELEKPQVRDLARAAGLDVADKPESQDLCFLAGSDTRAFMRRHGGRALRAASAGGEIVDREGSVLGRHGGHHTFTVGQRRGLGVGATEPLYVLRKDAPRNRVVVGPRSALLTERVRLEPLELHRPAGAVETVRLRYHAAPVPCAPGSDLPAGRHESVDLRLERAVGGAAPGQTGCLMSQDLVVGWGVIADPFVDASS
jgi:tRNA-specific 2-thiouridylase